MSRKPTKKMIDRGVAFAWNVKLSSEYSWSQYVSDLYQHMDAGRDPAAVPGFFTSMAVSRIKRAVIDWETGLVSATESMSDVRAALAYADQQPMPPAPAVSPVDVEAVRGTIFRMKDNHKLRESRCKPDPLISIWANELARAIGENHG